MSAKSLAGSASSSASTSPMAASRATTCSCRAAAWRRPSSCCASAAIPHYGKNDFHDNGDGTITDRATGLMWSKADSGKGMNWQDALAWVQKKNAEKYLGHDDWRLPSVKELQSIVDYTRSPDTTHSPAIDPLFTCTAITNEARKADYPFYWSATTHAGFMGGGAAMYVAFGRAAGWMSPRAHGGRATGPARRFRSRPARRLPAGLARAVRRAWPAARCR